MYCQVSCGGPARALNSGSRWNSYPTSGSKTTVLASLGVPNNQGGYKGHGFTSWPNTREIKVKELSCPLSLNLKYAHISNSVSSWYIQIVREKDPCIMIIPWMSWSCDSTRNSSSSMFSSSSMSQLCTEAMENKTKLNTDEYSVLIFQQQNNNQISKSNHTYSWTIK